MAGTHERNVGPMQSAPRCGAATRSGGSCCAPRIIGATRCRMHGGKGSGAPKGNCNALKDGLYTAAMQKRASRVRGLLRAVRSLSNIAEARWGK